MSFLNESEEDMEVILDLGRAVRWRHETMRRLQASGIELPSIIAATWARVVTLPWPAFVQAFEELLHDPDGYVRIRAAWILRIFAGRSYISTFNYILSSDRPR